MTHNIRQAGTTPELNGKTELRPVNGNTEVQLQKQIWVPFRGTGDRDS